MSHVTYVIEWGYAYKRAVSHVWKGHVKCMNESCHTYKCLHTRHYERPPWAHWNLQIWVMSRIWSNHVTCMNELCHMYEWVISHIQMVRFELLRTPSIRSLKSTCWSHATHMNESYHAYEWAVSYVWMSHVTCMNESCHVYGWVMSAIRILNFNILRTPYIGSLNLTSLSHVAHVNETCHMYEWVASHVWMSHVSQTNAYIRGTTDALNKNFFFKSTCWSHVSHINKSSHVTHMNESRMNESCHAHEWVVSHAWMSTVTCMNESFYMYEWVMSHMWMSHVSHTPRQIDSILIKSPRTGLSAQLVLEVCGWILTNFIPVYVCSSTVWDQIWGAHVFTKVESIWCGMLELNSNE